MKKCETCGTKFKPRPAQLRAGQGRFCSQRCNSAAIAALNTPETKAKAKERQRQLRAAGIIKMPTGSANPKWRGGQKARNKRRTESGRSAEYQRERRKANPALYREMDRERRHRRREQKGGRLARGTIPSMGEAQQWCCNLCRKDIRHAYHIDHIIPLSRGGRHTAANIQLLCPPCNLRKGAKLDNKSARQDRQDEQR